MKLELRKLGQRWMGTNQASQATLDEQTLKGLITEYNTLRSEMHNAQGRRMQITSFTVATFGVILSITGNHVLGSASTEPGKQLWVAVGGAIVTYAIIISSLIMMTAAQRSIERLGGYICIFIEPRVPGLNWEYHRRGARTPDRRKRGRGISVIYYFLSTLALLLPIYALGQYTQGWATTLILVPFFAYSIYLGYNLQTGASKDKEWMQWEKYASKLTMSA
ncbi:MAG: hypothetical protein PVF45_01685 [Anaerolineae bacterium]|jgi:hypothetical protein